MEIRGHGGVVTFDGTTVTLARRSGDVAQFPAECVHAAWVDRVGRGLRSLSFTVISDGTVSTYRMFFSWRCAEQLNALQDQVMTVRLYGSRDHAVRRLTVSPGMDGPALTNMRKDVPPSMRRLPT